MTDMVRPPTPLSALVANPNARKDTTEPELDDEGEPGLDENAAGFLKNATNAVDASDGGKDKARRQSQSSARQQGKS